MANYGGVDDEEPKRGDSNAKPPSDAEVRAHARATLALCSSVFANFYLTFNVVPYSGFMPLQLVPGLSRAQVGVYAGVLTGSMKIASMFSAYPWGVISDTYGRKFCLLFSSSTCSVLMVAFGFSPTYGFAVGVRVLLGLCNGVMTAARVSATELAKGNHELEAQGMGLIMSMVGVGMLVAPALGGLLSEPVTQYPSVNFGAFEPLLLRFPFLLPNLVGGVVNAVATIMVALTVEETLPPHRLRGVEHVLPDALSLIRDKISGLASVWGKARRGGSEYEEVDGGAGGGRPSLEVRMSSLITRFSDSSGDGSETDPLKIAVSHTDDCGVGAEVACVSRAGRMSFSKALQAQQSIPRSSLASVVDEEGNQDTTISSLMGEKRVRELLVAYWVITLANAAGAECFPLFAMVLEGGLGVEEVFIGAVGTGGGLLFVASQYFIFSWSMKYWGLHKTMLVSGFVAVTPSILTPVAILLLPVSMKAVLVFLIVLNGSMSIFFSNWNACKSPPPLPFPLNASLVPNEAKRAEPHNDATTAGKGSSRNWTLLSYLCMG
ncbi:hypothetical protein ACHAWF_004688 [Thalassiosira exigua]